MQHRLELQERRPSCIHKRSQSEEEAMLFATRENFLDSEEGMRESRPILPQLLIGVNPVQETRPMTGGRVDCHGSIGGGVARDTGIPQPGNVLSLRDPVSRTGAMRLGTTLLCHGRSFRRPDVAAGRFPRDRSDLALNSGAASVGNQRAS